MPKQLAKPVRVEANPIEIFRIVFTREVRSALERCHCGERPDVREAWLRRKQSQRSALIRAERIGLISPVQILCTGANRMIAMFGSLMIGEQALCFFVELARLGIVP